MTSTAIISPALIAERFEALGFIVSEDTTSSLTSSDRAVVFTAVRLDTNVDTSVTLIATSTVQRVVLPKPSFQPVWNVPQWCSTGLELLVLTDTDACAQLDALSEALDLPRESITIKPRVGGQRYGHPDAVDLG